MGESQSPTGDLSPFLLGRDLLCCRNGTACTAGAVRNIKEPSAKSCPVYTLPRGFGTHGFWFS